MVGRAAGVAGFITGVSVAHDHASLATIEAATPADTAHELERLLATTSIREGLVVITCNRTEWYVVTDRESTGRTVLEDLLPAPAIDAGRWFDHDGSIEHLLSLGAGLESMIVGEDQILGQLRDAALIAEDQDALGPILDRTVWKAIHTGEQVRSETAINEGVTSLGSAAVVRASTEIDLEGSTAAVIGAGEMARLAASALAAADVEALVVSNRSQKRARELAEGLDVPTRVAGLEALEEVLATASVAITATGSTDPLIEAAIVDDAGETVLVDVAQPRDVADAVDEFDHISRYDLEDIEAVTERTNRDREAAAAAARTYVDRAKESLADELKRQQADDAIAAMYAGAEQIKARELEEALTRFREGEASTATVLEEFADAMVGQLLAAPTKSLRDAAAEDDWATIQTALRLFDPDFTEGGISQADFEDRRSAQFSESQAQR